MTVFSRYDNDPDPEEILRIQQREESLRKLMNETRCEIVQENGQRKLGGPPPSKYTGFHVSFVVQPQSKISDSVSSFFS